eukprot:COSAG02_NODE_54076_length_298_cov_0.763819_1_plen_60_part_01
MRVRARARALYLSACMLIIYSIGIAGLVLIMNASRRSVRMLCRASPARRRPIATAGGAPG